MFHAIDNVLGSKNSGTSYPPGPSLPNTGVEPVSTAHFMRGGHTSRYTNSDWMTVRTALQVHADNPYFTYLTSVRHR
ncbi:hypothetical protein PGTUg99_018345 [Puccinia graminis f. sp. tritici]|uniref:Uncharacterized protein n=1 Tax=Puccinia graminis f. sp. tritici TaxID=56615 RepID=A0A5B0Q0Z5_PUCGR|nr:hypothetical protein PGTUg99_018345 [Puccinia graminis f. sp. tritici]